MAMVLSSEDESYFAPALRRSHSQPRFGAKNPGLRPSASTSRLSDLLSQPSVSSSAISSPPLSPKAERTESNEPSDLSTPATSSSLDSDCDESSASEDPQHQYDDRDYFSQPGTQEPPSSPQYDDSDAASDQDDAATISRPGSPILQDRAEDDTALRPQPSRHVDYLSHDWREEDIWSSWKLIVSRRSDYNNAARLENASWRTWMKSKNNLGTVPAETLNWLKDCDVTWLYGPLQTGTSSADHASTSSNSARISKSNSFTKKPILKKRSMSEIMLQRSLSTSSLVKQAAAAVQAQQQGGGRRRIGRRSGLDRDTNDYVTFPFSSRDGSSRYPSTRSSGVASPSGGRKHIHFNEQVSQCIAVDVRGDDDDDDDEFDADRYRYDSDSDDEGIVMKVPRVRKKRPVLKKKKSKANVGESKTIAMLPSTTLKCQDETPEPDGSAVKHSPSGGLRSPVLSPSSSQETLRPTKKPTKLFFAGDEDDDDDGDNDGDVDKIDIGPGSFSAPQHSEGGGGLRRSTSSTSLSGGSGGMRRTTSGIFRPLEEPVPAPSDDGLMGQILKTVNTARDIAHVVWNVGWRS